MNINEGWNPAFTQSKHFDLTSQRRRNLEVDSDEITRITIEVEQLKNDLSLERKLRYDAEQKIIALQSELTALKSAPTRKRRTKKEIEEAGEQCYSEFKSDGKRKAHRAESIRSYDDFRAIQDYFLANDRIRDWALWTVGVSLGLRISDLFSLKIQDVLNEDGTFKERIRIIEQKTSKANNCIITESVMNALTTYFDTLGWSFARNDYVFRSQKTKGKIREEYGWKIMSDAGKALNLPMSIGSHTMRKSFANIAACVDKSNIDMNSITKIQGLLNHSDQKVTMRYLDTYQTMFDNARKAVSDFVLGRTSVNTLVAGTNVSLSEIMSKLEEVESKITLK